MALVPFTAASSASAAPPASSRAGGPVRAPQANPAGTGPSTRVGNDAAGPVRQAGPKEKPPSAFARALAAAQDDESAAPVAERTTASRRRTASTQDTLAADVETQGEDDAPAVTSAVTPATEPRVVPASSWLLLALGQGVDSIGHTDHDSAVLGGDSDVESEVDDDALAEEAASPIDPAALMPALVVPVTTLPVVTPLPVVPQNQGAVETTGQGVAAVEPALETHAAGQATTLVVPTPSVTGSQSVEGPVDEALAITTGASVQEAGSSATAIETPLAATAPSAERTAEVAPATSSVEAAAAEVVAALTESTPRPAPEAVARWRAAARALAASSGPKIATVAAATPTGVAASERVAVPAAATTHASASPGAAVKALAHLLGANGQATETSGRIAWTASSAGAAPTVTADDVTPTARAVEVLSRLAAREPQPELLRTVEQTAASVFGGMLASQSSAPAASAVSAPAPMPGLPPAVGEQVNTHIVSSLKMQWKDGVGEAKLHLRPDALGSVTVALRVEQGAVTAVVRADSPQVQEWVLQHQQTLRQQMEAAGLRLDELTVSPDDRGQQDQREPPAEQRRRARRGRADDADAPVFELLA